MPGSGHVVPSGPFSAAWLLPGSRQRFRFLRRVTAGRSRPSTTGENPVSPPVGVDRPSKPADGRHTPGSDLRWGLSALRGENCLPLRIGIFPR
jgi:hypothetical protein